MKNKAFSSLDISNLAVVTSGNHSAVTGGIGTEKLYDIAQGIDLKLSYKDKAQRINSLVFDAAMDYYSSAS
jgi:hypothetical protein